MLLASHTHNIHITCTSHIHPVQHLNHHPHPIPSLSSAPLIISYTHTPTQSAHISNPPCGFAQAKTKGAHPQQVGLLPGEQVPRLWQRGCERPPLLRKPSTTFYSQARRIEIVLKALLTALGPPGRPLQTREEGRGCKGLKLPSSLLPKPCSMAVSGPALVIKPGLTQSGKLRSSGVWLSPGRHPPTRDAQSQRPGCPLAPGTQ